MARKVQAPAVRFEEFVFWLSVPSVSYSFGVEHDRRRREWQPFAERHTLNFVTECIYPNRFNDRRGKATIYPEPALVDFQLLSDDDVRRRWIGYVRATKSEFEAVLWLPPKVLRPLGEAMASGLVRSMLTNGAVEPRGMHRVVSVAFRGQDFDPVGYIG